MSLLFWAVCRGGSGTAEEIQVRRWRTGGTRGVCWRNTADTRGSDSADGDGSWKYGGGGRDARGRLWQELGATAGHHSGSADGAHSDDTVAVGSIEQKFGKSSKFGVVLLLKLLNFEEIWL